MISFKVTREEHDTIGKIVDRAIEAAAKAGVDVDRTELFMDITACHANGCPLKLQKLLAAPGFDFSHDVFGIHRHINRRTGKLEDFFLPRYAV